jgi:hypothetical protein
MRPSSVLPLAVVAVFLTQPLHGQNPIHVAPNAPRDRTLAMDSCILAAAEKAIAPLTIEAKVTYPGAKARFQKGLPPKHSLFVVTHLRDSLGKFERVFIAVDSIRDSVGGSARIFGRIWNQITLVRGYRLYQAYALPEAELLDWLISRPDGSEEGNLIGNFLDRWQPPPACLRIKPPSNPHLELSGA